jgi:hypothetical protein
MISNLGKGDLNNGLTIYLYDKQKKQEYLKTLEYTNKKLNAVKDKISIQLENQASITMNYHLLWIRANSSEEEPVFFTEFSIPIDINNQNLSIKSSLSIKNNRIFYNFIYLPPQRITFRFNNESYESFGAMGMECLYTEDSPLSIANSFYFIRNFNYKNKLLIFLINDKTGKIHFNQNNYDITDQNKLSIEKKFLLENSHCKIESKSFEYLGGFYVLNNVSAILRWFLSLVGIEPYIKHYKTNLSYDCFDTKETFPFIQFTHIQLKR